MLVTKHPRGRARRFHLTLLLVLLALPACSRGEAAPEPDAAAPLPSATIAPESLHTVADAEVPEWIVTTGSLVAHDRADVVPNTAGKVLEVLVERGSHVELGDPLVRLDVRNASLDVREAKANLAGLEAARELADATCQRSSTLHAQGAVSGADVDRDQAQCRQAEQNVRAARVRAQEASKAVSDGIVRAPFAGTVTERKVSVGEWANLGATILTLVEDGPLRAELELSEAASVHVALGTKVELQAVALPERTFVGTVTRMAPDLDAASRTRVVEVELPSDDDLVAGMFVRAKVITGTRKLPVVPREALLQRGDTQRVFVIAAGVVEERIVQVGPPLDAGRVAIVRGLAAGESIVVAGLAALRDGQPVGAHQD